MKTFVSAQLICGRLMCTFDSPANFLSKSPKIAGEIPKSFVKISIFLKKNALCRKTPLGL